MGAMTFLLLLLALAPGRALADEPAITFLFGDAVVLQLTAAQLRALPGTKEIELSDPFYDGRRKRYRAAPLKDLLAAAYGASETKNEEFLFEARDGYRSHAKAALLSEEGGFLAFEDLDAPSWEELPREKAKPGPFYLVWTGARQSPKNGYPWPWQIATVKPARIEDEFPKAVPRAAAPDSRAAAGWTIFRSRCLSCHAISGQGGSVGPDLNEPRGITRYHDKGELKAYIHRASSFRHTKMPDFDELTPRDLDDLVAYFDFMTEQAGTK